MSDETNSATGNETNATASPVELYCRDLGGRGRAPMIVLHGLLGSTRNWQTAGAELARAGVAHLLALDLRNHGRSPHTPTMSYDEMVADVIAWMDSRQLMRALVMGHSLGGKVAMALACRFPQRVARLIVVDIAPKEYHSLSHRDELAAMSELDLRVIRRRDEAEAHFEKRVADPVMRKFLVTNLKRDDETGGLVWMPDVPAIAAALPGLEENPLRAGEVYEGETLFIACGKSDYVREDEDRVTIMRHFPNARIETLVDSGHNPHVEAREEFVQVVGRFLK
jgi:pimeloyl-ACP methyl ester carboxylesterase